MRNSIVIQVLINIYSKLALYYRYSAFCRVLGRLEESFRSSAASSCILGFFNREWKIGSAWKGSFTFKLVIQPLRLFRYGSDKLSDRTNIVLEGSKALSGTKTMLSSLFTMSTRVYGLLFLTYAATQGLLELVLRNGDILLDTKGIIRLALLLTGTVLILINRSLKSLMEGSIIGREAYDFFIVRGLKDGTDNQV